MHLHIGAYENHYQNDAELLFQEHAPQFFTHQDVKHFRQKLIDFHESPVEQKVKSPIFILVLNHLLSGIALVTREFDSPTYFQLLCIAVKKDRLRRGLGSHLMSHVIEQVKNLGGKYLILKTSHEPYNEQTRSFYLKHAFIPVGILPGYYPDVTPNYQTLEDCAIYSRKI